MQLQPLPSWPLDTIALHGYLMGESVSDCCPFFSKEPQCSKHVVRYGYLNLTCKDKCQQPNSLSLYIVHRLILHPLINPIIITTILRRVLLDW